MKRSKKKSKVVAGGSTNDFLKWVTKFQQTQTKGGKQSWALKCPSHNLESFQPASIDRGDPKESLLKLKIQSSTFGEAEVASEQGARDAQSGPL